MNDETRQLLESLKKRAAEMLTDIDPDDGLPVIRYPQHLLDVTKVIKEVWLMEKPLYENQAETEVEAVTFLPIMPIKS